MTDKFPYFYDDEFDEKTNKQINAEIMKYAGIYLLKKMDPEAPEDAQHTFRVPLDREDEILEKVLDDLLFHELIEIDTKKAKYVLTDKGKQYTERLVDEVEGYIRKYDEFDLDTKVNLIKRDGYNPLRVRFLWGWYDGEFDDLTDFQHQMEYEEDEIYDSWQEYIVSKEFLDVLFEDINVLYDFDDEELDKVVEEARQDREKRMASQDNIEQHSLMRDDNGREVVEREYYYADPHYYNPVHDPLFWFIVFW